jgi:hypothetical protein
MGRGNAVLHTPNLQGVKRDDLSLGGRIGGRARCKWTATLSPVDQPAIGHSDNLISRRSPLDAKFLWPRWEFKISHVEDGLELAGGMQARSYCVHQASERIHRRRDMHCISYHQKVTSSFVRLAPSTLGVLYWRVNWDGETWLVTLWRFYTMQTP